MEEPVGGLLRSSLAGNSYSPISQVRVPQPTPTYYLSHIFAARDDFWAPSGASFSLQPGLQPRSVRRLKPPLQDKAQCHLIFPTLGWLGGVSLSRLPPGFRPAFRADPQWRVFASIAKSVGCRAVWPIRLMVSRIQRDAGQKPGGSLERLTPQTGNTFKEN